MTKTRKYFFRFLYDCEAGKNYTFDILIEAETKEKAINTFPGRAKEAKPQATNFRIKKISTQAWN